MIHKNVMRRVRTIHTLRALFGSVGVSFVVLALSLYLIGREVWVARVFQNMPHTGDILAVGRFFLDAFEATDFVVQGLTVLTILAFAWIARELGRMISVQTWRAV